MRKRVIAALSGLLALLLAAFGLGIGLTSTTATTAAASADKSGPSDVAESELETLAVTDEDEDAADEETPAPPANRSTNTTPGGQPSPGSTDAPADETPEAPEDEVPVDEGEGPQLPTLPADETAPTITVKTDLSVGGPVYSSLSLKLYDAGKIDRVVINGQVKDLTDNAWSDVNFLTVGSFGIQDGVPFTVVAFDVAGNSTTQTFTLDGTGPTITVKPESVGGPDAFTSLSLKLYDRFQVDYVVINGVKKELTNNQWSDVNGLRVEQFGIQDGVPFTVVAYDVLGNSSSAVFTLDGTAPTMTVKSQSDTAVSLKLFDRFQVDYIEINGVKKDLTNNQWSDANDLRVGTFGIQDGVPFTVRLVDVAGNSSSQQFTLSATAPVVALRVAPPVEVEAPAVVEAPEESTEAELPALEESTEESTEVE